MNKTRRMSLQREASGEPTVPQMLEQLNTILGRDGKQKGLALNSKEFYSLGLNCWDYSLAMAL